MRALANLSWMRLGRRLCMALLALLLALVLAVLLVQGLWARGYAMAPLNAGLNQQIQTKLRPGQQMQLRLGRLDLGWHSARIEQLQVQAPNLNLQVAQVRLAWQWQPSWRDVLLRHKMPTLHWQHLQLQQPQLRLTLDAQQHWQPPWPSTGSAVPQWPAWQVQQGRMQLVDAQGQELLQLQHLDAQAPAGQWPAWSLWLQTQLHVASPQAPAWARTQPWWIRVQTRALPVSARAPVPAMQVQWWVQPPPLAPQGAAQPASHWAMQGQCDRWQWPAAQPALWPWRAQACQLALPSWLGTRLRWQDLQLQATPEHWQLEVDQPQWQQTWGQVQAQHLQLNLPAAGVGSGLTGQAEQLQAQGAWGLGSADSGRWLWHSAHLQGQIRPGAPWLRTASGRLQIQAGTWQGLSLAGAWEFGAASAWGGTSGAWPHWRVQGQGQWTPPGGRALEHAAAAWSLQPPAAAAPTLWQLQLHLAQLRGPWSSLPAAPARPAALSPAAWPHSLCAPVAGLVQALQPSEPAWVSVTSAREPLNPSPVSRKPWATSGRT